MPEGKSRKNMRFCETNRIDRAVFFDVTFSEWDSCTNTLEDLNPVRLAKLNLFLARLARGDGQCGDGWALDSLAGGDIVKLESDKNCRIQKRRPMASRKTDHG
jgi:hypothetical protein